MTESKITRNAHGTFVMQRLEAPREFVCDRCLQAKVSRIVVAWATSDGRDKRICNGCYGRLLSGKPF